MYMNFGRDWILSEEEVAAIRKGRKIVHKPQFLPRRKGAGPVEMTKREIARYEVRRAENGRGLRRPIVNGEMRCNECREYKSLTEYYVHQKKSNDATGYKHYDSYCNPCRKAKQVAKRYGLGLREYRDMLALSGGKCKICGDAVGDRPNIDHCHKSSAIRGVLCTRCNSGLGLFRDNPKILLAAATYLDPYALDNI
jgi:hypothetical protein